MKKWLNLKTFKLGWMRSGKLWGNVMGQDCELSVVNWRELSKTCLFNFFWAPLCLGDKDAPFFQV